MRKHQTTTSVCPSSPFLWLKFDCCSKEHTIIVFYTAGCLPCQLILKWFLCQLSPPVGFYSQAHAYHLTKIPLWSCISPVLENGILWYEVHEFWSSLWLFWLHCISLKYKPWLEQSCLICSANVHHKSMIAWLTFFVDTDKNIKSKLLHIKLF